MTKSTVISSIKTYGQNELRTFLQQLFTLEWTIAFTLFTSVYILGLQIILINKINIKVDMLLFSISIRHSLKAKLLLKL